MVSKDSPKFKTTARGSPKFGSLLAAESATKKMCSPKSGGVNKGSPRGKQRASWNPALEKSLVDILHEYKDTGFRGDTGCRNSEIWNRMVKEFHDRNRYVSFTKPQIQEKESQLKRDYKMLKEARRQSGSSWNYERHMVDMRPAMWDKLIVSFPKIKKFRNNKGSFPLYDALQELYDGHLVEGNHNFTSLGSPQEGEPLKQTHDVGDEAQDLEDEERQDHRIEDEDRQVHRIEDEESEGENERKRQERHDEENEAARAERGQENERKRQQRRVGPVTTNKEEKEGKRPRKSANIGGMMESSLETRTRQTEDEAARLAKEKDSAQASDFSIKRCISVLSTMEVTKEEKAKAYTVFIKNKKNREAFLCACEDDPEAAMIWLRSEMD